MNANSILPAILLWVVLPFWLLAGLGDYFCHRRTRIEETSGAPESKLHIAQFVQIVVPTLMGLFLRINLPILAFMALGIRIELERSGDTGLSAHREEPALGGRLHRGRRGRLVCRRDTDPRGVVAHLSTPPERHPWIHGWPNVS